MSRQIEDDLSPFKILPETYSNFIAARFATTTKNLKRRNPVLHPTDCIARALRTKNQPQPQHYKAALGIDRIA